MSYLEGDLRFFRTKLDTNQIIVTMNVRNTFKTCSYESYDSFFWNNNRSLIQDILVRSEKLKAYFYRFPHATMHRAFTRYLKE
jgi:hypothetical protein